MRPDCAALWATECDAHHGWAQSDHIVIQSVGVQYLPKHTLVQTPPWLNWLRVKLVLYKKHKSVG